LRAMAGGPLSPAAASADAPAEGTETTSVEAES